MCKERKSCLREHWLTLLIAVQPLLDVLAYFCQNDTATVAGYIRLAILVALPVYVLWTRRSMGFFLGLVVIGGYCLLHVLNDFRVGCISLRYDLSYMLRVVQMPVLCLCFMQLIRDEETKEQVLRGILAAAILTALAIPLAWITGTGNVTYGEGLGYSGWVIDDNRCANSILLVTLSVFCLYFAHRTGRKWLSALIPPVMGIYLFTNGTKSCYYGLFVLCAGFAGYLLLEKLLLKKKLKTVLLCSLILTMAAGVLLFPYSPRYRVDQELRKGLAVDRLKGEPQEVFVDENPGAEMGTIQDPEAQKAYLDKLYRRHLGGYPDLYRRFGMDRVMEQYHNTTDLTVLRDARIAELTYAKMIWEDSDTLTKLLGFEASQVGFDGRYDMENDWPSLFYYYGYVGLGLYVAFVLLFLLRILRALIRDFRGSLTALNFALLLCLALQLGLAQYSGAILRRPNVSVYLALVLALIWYQTREKERAA
jgi:hypothetical protein